MNNYYITYVVGIDDSFEITTDKINDSIGLADKKAYAKIIVKPYFGGFVEIVTGKKYKAVIMKDSNNAKIPANPVFVIDDRKTNKNRMQEATKEEVKEYIIKYNEKKDEYLNKLNEIDAKCNEYLVNGEINKRIVDSILR